MLPRGRRFVVGTVAIALTALLARGGVAPAEAVRFANAGFQNGLSGWTVVGPSGSSAAPSAGPLGDRSCVTLHAPTGALELVRALGVGAGSESGLSAPAAGELGERLEFAAWLCVGVDVTSGTAWLEVACRSGTTRTVVARSEALDPSAPRDRWIFLATRPIAPADARLLAASDAVELVVHDGFDGTLFADDVVFGPAEPGVFDVGGDFEDDFALLAWQRTSAVRTSAEYGTRESQYGTRSLCFPARVAGTARRILAIDGRPGAPVHGSRLEAGVWLRFPAELGAPTAGGSAVLRLELRALRPGEPARLGVPVAAAVAEAEGEAWTFVRTRELAAVPLDADRIVLELAKSGAGAVFADLAQAGERGAVHGFTPRHVSCNYVARYRSPFGPASVTSPADPRAAWGTWAWTDAPSCAPGSTALRHDPSCQTGLPCRRANGRRDLAITTLHGVDELPLAGAYDSRDPDVVAWHVELARAAGVDSLVFDYYGHTLAQATLAQTGEELNEHALEVLLDVCDAPGTDLKVAVMYEPKVHFLGWVQGEPTLAAKRAGIRADLSHAVSSWGRRRAWLAYDGRPVVFVFANALCSPDGTQCLGEADWTAILDGVELDTGLRPFVIADEIPAADSRAFRGVSRWSLVYGTLLRYPSWGRFVQDLPAMPPPGVAALSAFAALVHGLGEQWARRDEPGRVAIPVVWPGFDDTGVAGWSGGNFPGSDGAPVCVRVAEPMSGFYATTVASALATRPRWVQIATWNDWNEWTQIEPRWDAGYAQAARAGALPDAAALRRACGRLIETQAWIAAFKGVELDPRALNAAAAGYVRRAATDPHVARYD